MTSFVAHHGSLGSAWVLRMLGLTGLIGEYVNFTDDPSFVFVNQGPVKNGDEESMAAMVPSDSPIFWRETSC